MVRNASQSFASLVGDVCPPLQLREADVSKEAGGKQRPKRNELWWYVCLSTHHPSHAVATIILPLVPIST